MKRRRLTNLEKRLIWERFKPTALMMISASFAVFGAMIFFNGVDAKYEETGSMWVALGIEEVGDTIRQLKSTIEADKEGKAKNEDKVEIEDKTKSEDTIDNNNTNNINSTSEGK